MSHRANGPIPAFGRPTAVFAVALLAILPGTGVAQTDTGAVGNGNWSSAATWTNGVPGPNDRAFIGSSYPSGAATNATVALTQNSSVNQVYVCNGTGTSGTLDLGGFNLTANLLSFGISSLGSASLMRTGGGTLSIQGNTSVLVGSLVLLPGDVTSELDVGNNAMATTAAVGNVTSTVEILPGAGTLTLGADLNLPGEMFLTASGTLNANGHTISTALVSLSSVYGSFSFHNEGLVNAGTWLENGSIFQIRHPGDTIGTLNLTSSSLAVRDAAGQNSGLTLANVLLSDLDVQFGSDLLLEVNGQANGWIFRWANPSGGDHIADLQTLINGGEITFSYLNGGSYTLTADSSYTYVNVIPVPEPSTLLLSLAAAGVLAMRVRNNRKK